MIPQVCPTTQPLSWERQLAEAIRSPSALLHALNLSTEFIKIDEDSPFPLLVPRSFLSRMKPGDPNDPLLRQVLSLEVERQYTPGFSEQPLEELEARPLPGLLHKFNSRVLLTLTGTCPVHCRYCFRRYFPYRENSGRSHWAEWVSYVAERPDIHEVIFSGGDPLSLPDKLLGQLIAAFSDIAHVKVIRFHTRFPVMIPARVTEALLSLLDQSPKKIVVVLHINHPNEICDEIKDKARLLSASNVQLLCQSVLLKGINDCADTLADLSWALCDANILPYYVHLLDKVSGAAHFLISDTRANSIYKALQAQLPGYLVPQFVREVPGTASKQPLIAR